MAAQDYYNGYPDGNSSFHPEQTGPPPQYQSVEYGWKPEYPNSPRPRPQERPQNPPQPPRPQNYAPQAYQSQLHPPTYPHQGPEAYQFPAHLRPERSYSEPPNPSYQRHRHSRSPSYSQSSRHSRSRSRRRSHSHERSRNHSSSHRSKPVKRDHTSRNTFLGAFGGGAIGDLIFPGLGTLAGAAFGGVGGYEHSKNRRKGRSTDGRSRTKHRNRDTYDEDWELGRRARGKI